jgi:hypothetical protein
VVFGPKLLEGLATATIRIGKLLELSFAIFLADLPINFDVRDFAEFPVQRLNWIFAIIIRYGPR